MTQHRPKVVFGAGSFDALADEVGELGRRVLLISGRSTGAPIAIARTQLGDRVVAHFPEARQHVPEEDAIDARRLAARTRADCVVAIGGGSAIGLAKSIAIEADIPIVAVPTTYSGSEMTPFYGITADGEKRTDRDDRVLPKVVIYDPALTTPLSTAVTVASGMNAVAHCAEAMYAADVTSELLDTAEEALRALVRGVAGSVQDPLDLDARSEALRGAHLAGSVLAAAGMALHHTIVHVLGGSYGLPHGPTNAALLPQVLRFNEPAAPQAMKRMGRALDVDDVPVGVFELNRSLGGPTSLAELGLFEGDVEGAAWRAVKMSKFNPRPVTEADVVEILRAAHAGRQP